MEGGRERMVIYQSERRKDTIDMLIEIEDEKGKIFDEEIIELILMCLIVDHESSAHANNVGNCPPR
jgi:cytochrome P450